MVEPTAPPVDNSPRARVVRHLQEWVRDGRLAPGARLPSELHLAGKFNVSRNTVRTALADLNSQGLIRLGHRKWLVEDGISPSTTALANSVVIVVEPSDSLLDYSHLPKTSSHISFILLGALAALRRAGYDAFVAHPDSVHGDLVHRVISQRPKGTIILSKVLQEDPGAQLSAALQEGNIPSVIYGDLDLISRNPRAVADLDSVISDHEQGAYELTKWLIAQGRKRILRFWQTHLDGPEKRLFWLAQRDLGYLRAMSEAGLDPLPPLEVYDPNHRTFGLAQKGFDYCTRVTAGYLLDHLQGPDPIDAVMAASDDTIGIFSAALALHGKVPNRDVLLVGYDDSWEDLEPMLRAGYPGPAASVNKRNLDIGLNLVELLLDRMNGNLFKEPERRVITPTLVLRPQALP